MNTSIIPIVDALEKAHAHFNRELFHGSLTGCPVITVAPCGRKKALGWYAPERWQNGTSRPSELNLSAEDLKRPVDAVLTTLVHEMAHQLSHQCARKDTSRNGAYHNKRFRDTASACGLICDENPDKRHGWSFTKPGPRALTAFESIRSSVEPALTLFRPPEDPKKSKGKMLLWVCACPVKIRSGRKDLHITCDDCCDPFVLASGADDPDDDVQ